VVVSSVAVHRGWCRLGGARWAEPEQAQLVLDLEDFVVDDEAERSAFKLVRHLSEVEA
jgi:hypothetical protein